MRTLAKPMVTFTVVLSMIVAGYYFYRSADAKEHGRGYELRQVPGDLVREVAGIFDRDRDGATPPTRVPPGTEPGASPADRPAAGSSAGDPGGVEPARDGADLFEEGRQLYMDADFSGALPLLQASLFGAGAPDRATATELADRARLFRLLLSGEKEGSALEQGPIAFLRMKRGEPFLARVVEADSNVIRFRKPNGIDAAVPKSRLEECRVAKTLEQKKAILEQEYQRRHEGIEGAGAYLELARFAWAAGQKSHVTYLLEKSLEEKGDAVEGALYARFLAAARRGDTSGALAARDLLKRFFRDGAFTRKALEDDSPAIRPVLPGRPDPGAAAPGHSPPSGIGGVDERKGPRSRNPEIDALLEKASKLRDEGDEEYLHSFPGNPDRAEHRKKALKAYKKARELYTEVEEKWGVGLDRTFQHLNERIYQLQKDMPIK